MVRSMMSYSDLLKFLWGYALEMKACSLNLVPTKSVPNTTIELWTGHKASKQHYKIWECLAYVLKAKTEKLYTKSNYVVGYPKLTKC